MIYIMRHVALQTITTGNGWFLINAPVGQINVGNYRDNVAMHFKLKSDANRKVHLNMDAINAYVSRWVPGTQIDFEVVRRQRRVSSPMRRYYFAAVLPPFMEHLGYEPEEQMIFHRQLKIVYFQVKPDSHGIYREKDIPSVFGNDSELGIDIKKEFTEWVKRKAAQEGVYIPDPGEE